MPSSGAPGIQIRVARLFLSSRCAVLHTADSAHGDFLLTSPPLLLAFDTPTVDIRPFRHRPLNWMTFHVTRVLRTSSIISTSCRTMPTLLEQVLAKVTRPEDVKIRNAVRTNELFQKLASQGPHSLQVITDFDATLTRYHLNGNKCDSCYGVIASTPLITADYRKKALELYNKYYPNEANPKMAIEDKIPHMIEWYELSHEFMASTEPRLNKNKIKEMVQQSTCFLRDNAKELLEELHHLEVPVLVLSAGIGDLVQEVLRNNSADLPNVKVISNFMVFDDKDDVVGFKDPLIHMYNKNKAAVHDMHCQYFEDLRSRRNVILMGDNLGDTNMGHGVSNSDVILKIGFLNSEVEKNLELFMDAFDVVLVDDQSMNFVSLLLSLIVKS